MKLKFFIFSILIISLVVGCNDSQSTDTDSSDLHNINYSTENDAESDIMVGNNDSQHTDGLDLYNEISNSEDIVAEPHQELNADDWLEEYLEQWWEEFIKQLDKTNVDHILRGPYTPADRDIDLHRIERFVFSIGGEHGGYGFVLDKMYGRVYFNPSTPAVHMLEFIKFSAEFKEEDLERVIKAIEDSGLRDWVYFYEGADHYEGSHGWQLGILFDDGTMMRRRGWGITEENPTLLQQYLILIGFIREIGAEIEARHSAEQEANP